MAISKRYISMLLCVLAISARVGYYVDTPLWLDYFRGNGTQNGTLPINSTNGTTHEIDPFFILITQVFMSTIFYGIVLLVLMVFWKDQISSVEREYPKRNFVVIGVSQGISSMLFNFAISGSRTAPYLQALLSNFTIPIQFTVRFFVLRKRPTCMKVTCAAAVLLAEFICLLPTIFPQLESSKDHQEEGGAKGIAGVLFPMSMVASQIPFALANSFLERSVQNKNQGRTNGHSQLNMVYLLFWWNFFILVTVSLSWWLDLVPGFGTSPSIRHFGETMWFNLQCLFGSGAGCDAGVVVLGWANYATCILAGFAFAALMRYSEGANFVIIVLTLRTPILFLFWTLFQEQPFHWNPETHLSTWLSIGAIAIMLPAIIIYDRAPPEHVKGRLDLEISVEEENRALLSDADSQNIINYGAQDDEDRDDQ